MAHQLVHLPSLAFGKFLRIGEVPVEQLQSHHQRRAEGCDLRHQLQAVGAVSLLVDEGDDLGPGRAGAAGQPHAG